METPRENGSDDGSGFAANPNWVPTNGTNSTLLFIAVEYIKEDAPTYKYDGDVTFPSPPYPEFTSPLDPNMSSTARYSPVYPDPVDPDGVEAFGSSVVVLQDGGAELAAPPQGFGEALPLAQGENRWAERANATEFDNSAPDEPVTIDKELHLVQFPVDGYQGLTIERNLKIDPDQVELLITDQNGISYGYVSQDFLVSRNNISALPEDETQLNNVLNTLENHGLVLEANDGAPLTIADGQMILQDPLLDSDLLLEAPVEIALDDGALINDSVVNDVPISKDIADLDPLSSMDLYDGRVKNEAPVVKEEFDPDEVSAMQLRRSRRQKNVEDDSQLCRVQSISDKPVPPRARASLPGSYLAINKLPGSTDYGVFARKVIPKRTQFGPLEGVLCEADDDTAFKLYIESEKGVMHKLDISDENTSNWMRFVRPAQTFNDQNLVLSQQGYSLYYTTTRPILPRQELQVGYSALYAAKRKLQTLQPTAEDGAWPCYECPAKFTTSDDLQKHLNVHDDFKGDLVKPRVKKMGRFKRRATIECPFCRRCFFRKNSLNRHLLSHTNALGRENQVRRHRLVGLGKSDYKCKICYLNLPSMSHLRSHELSHGPAETVTRYPQTDPDKTIDWKCDICYLTFPNASLLNLHELAHKSDTVETITGLPSDLGSRCPEGEFLVQSGDVQCPECSDEFPKLKLLIEHVASHGVRKYEPEVSRKKAHKCMLCYKGFATRERLQRHTLVHGSEENKPLKCDFCGKRFLNNSALACHLKTHKLDKNIFECPICKHTFGQVLMLKDHVKVHCVDGLYSCPHCEKVFKEYSIIRKHIRAFHCDSKHGCQYCGKPFRTLDKLRLHLLKHSDHREFLCADCGKQFKRKDKLKEHMKRMHAIDRDAHWPPPRPQKSNSIKKFMPKVQPTDYYRFIYKCHSCLLGFKRRGMLVNHLAKRHPDIRPDSVPELNLPILKTTRDYYCQYCEKVYKSSSKRKAHILKNHPGAELPMSNRRRAGAPPHDLSAGIPDPTFSQTVGSVTTNPHRCQWCHKQYASKAKLLQHQRKKHPEMMPTQRSTRVVKMQSASPGFPEDGKCVSSPTAPATADDITESIDMNSTYIECEDSKAALNEELNKTFKLADDSLLSQVVDDFDVSRPNQYYRIIPMSEDAPDTSPEPSRLYRLLTANGPFPPYPPR